MRLKFIPVLSVRAKLSHARERQGHRLFWELSFVLALRTGASLSGRLDGAGALSREVPGLAGRPGSHCGQRQRSAPSALVFLWEQVQTGDTNSSESGGDIYS